MDLLHHMKFLLTLLGITLILSQCSTQNNRYSHFENKVVSKHVTKLRTYDSPGRSAEVISYSHKLGLLLATDSTSKQVMCMQLSNPVTADPKPIDFNHAKRGIQGLQLGGEPTSVACHPNQPFAFTAVNQGHGRLIVFDLNAAAQGQKKVIIDQRIGLHLDSIAVSPNGQWVVVADEAEGNNNTPGNILVASTNGFRSGKNLTFRKVPGLAQALGRPAGSVEPEFIAIDPSSRFAAVSCQEDNAIAIIRLGNSPSLGSIIRLPSGSEPDGVHIIRSGGKTILGIAEEGADKASFYEINSSNLSTRLLSRVNVRHLGGQGSRSDPEGIALFHQGTNLYAAIGIERANRVLVLNLNNPSVPAKEAIVSTGSRPEDIIAISSGNSTIVISADEGKPGRGELSFIKVQ